ncbi:MAG: flavin reductase, partial [Flavobacteriaceae bacterium]|nr:flavin reductase [Flavobacteriaceae bacterium]
PLFTRSSAELADFISAHKSAKSEGVVVKNPASPYSSGRPASGGNALKLKFWESATVLVSEITPHKRSVRLCVSDGNKNLAVFNSIIHLGSNPALIGFTFRPLTVQRDTYKNIQETGVFTVNHVQEGFVGKAHQTAAKYPTNTSEFETVGLEAEYLEGTLAPFVKKSTIRYSCTYVNEYPIIENGCIMVVGAINALYLDEAFIAPDGWIDLAKANSIAGIGIDGYVKGVAPIRYEYAKPETKPQKK